MIGRALAHRKSELLAQRLIRETVLQEGVAPDQLTIHSGRGPSVRSQTVALPASLGITKSRSRRHVSNDSPPSTRLTPPIPSGSSANGHARSCRQPKSG